MKRFLLSLAAVTSCMTLYAYAPFVSVDKMLGGKRILYVERAQYAQDHHNTETFFQVGEINTEKFNGGSALRIYNIDSKKITTILESENGVIRDPELSYDARKIVFSMRRDINDYYHIYEISIDGTGLRQITFAEGASDIDPLYLPDGDILFTSTRQPKYCMCNRHIMGNLFRMEADGANINQIGFSTLFEGHSSILEDGRIIYFRWEYVDRNFGDAQGLWTVNPDGTKHATYYGNNTNSPGAVMDPRQIPGTDLIVCTFVACHELPWGALAIIDRKKGVDGAEPVVMLMPESSRQLIGNGDIDSFKRLEYFVEDPYPINENYFLVSSTINFKRHADNWNLAQSKSGLYIMGRDGTRQLLLEGTKDLFDPIIIAPRTKPAIIPQMRNHTDSTGVFYVQNVYEGTHVQGVEKGSVKYLRIVESPEKRTWTKGGWGGQGEQAPAVNWHSFETKRIIGEVEVEADGSANFTAPAGKYVYFQLLDKDKKMIQSMRSGTMLMPGEVNGCIGCHEDRLTVPTTTGNIPLALRKAPAEIKNWMGREPERFSYMKNVQPILDKHCVSCHDFGSGNPLVLAGDRNMFFNASYVNLYVNKEVKLIGGGPAEIQPAYSWGSHASALTKVIDGGHGDVKLSKAEKEVIYTWMDINGVYYPVYESAFDETIAGRSPLTNSEVDELSKLTGMNFYSLNHWQRGAVAQLSFERAHLSPCLEKIKGNKEKYERALALIRIGAERLKATPRGDIEQDVVVHPRLQQQLEHYTQRLKENQRSTEALAQGSKVYDTAVK